MTRRLIDLASVMVLLAAAAVCFMNLAAPDMQVWDEGDNVLVILESADAGHPFQLQRGGEPYFDKPPLWYWLTSVAIMALGPQETAFRLVSAVSGFLLVLAVLLLARRLFSPPAGVAAGLFMLAVRQLYIPRPADVFSTHNLRSADSDALMLLLAFGAFAALAARVRGRSWGLPLAALLSGLALMAKGPPGLMPLAAFVAWQLASRRRLRLGVREILISLAVLLVVTVPWHLAMIWIWGDAFLDRYPRYVLFRMSSGLPGHVPEATYYWRILSNHRVFFGLELTVLALVAAVVSRGRQEFRRAGPLLTLALTLLALNLSRTKIAWYVLPLYPYAALLVAAMVDSLWQRVQEPDRPAAEWRYRVWPAAAALAMGAWMGLFAAHNLASVARMPDGGVRRFFDRVEMACGGDAVYVDDRDTLHVRFLLRRYRMGRGEPGPADCRVARIDTPAASGEEIRAGLVAEGAGFTAWRPAAPPL